MTALLDWLILGALTVWWVRRWPLFQCRACNGQGMYRRGRRGRRCRVCGGSGMRVRWLLRTRLFGTLFKSRR